MAVARPRCQILRGCDAGLPRRRVDSRNFRTRSAWPVSRSRRSRRTSAMSRSCTAWTSTSPTARSPCWWARRAAASRTLLRMIAGLEEISGGEIRIGGKRRQRRAAEGARHRDGVPELRALSAHDGARQHGVRARAGQAGQGRRSTSKVEARRRDPRPDARCSTAIRASSRAASASAWRWAARSCATRRCSCSTSRCPTSTPSCAWRCAPRSRSCTSA